MIDPQSVSDVWSWLTNNWLYAQTHNYVSRSSYGPYVKYAHDYLGRLTEISNNEGPSGTQISEFSVPTSGGYDGASDLLSETASVPGSSSLSGTITNTFDNRSQLTNSASTQSAWSNNLSFVADQAGNLTTLRSASGYKFNSSENANNSRNELQLNSGAAFDANGNWTSYPASGGTALTFDPENRMTSYGSAITAMGYRFDGLRASKTNSSATTYFIYDINGNPVMETAGGSVSAINTFGANGLVSRYTSSAGSAFSLRWRFFCTFTGPRRGSSTKKPSYTTHSHARCPVR